MTTAKQLYELQDLDLELEMRAENLRQLTGQLGESAALREARERLAQESERLDKLRHDQHSLEWEIDDIAAKVSKASEELYSGRVRNPKELSGLEHDVGALTAKRREMEDRALELMEQIESGEANIGRLRAGLGGVEAEWQVQQARLRAEVERLQAGLAALRERREATARGISPDMVRFYLDLRSQKGLAVARVERGVCRGCRIMLSNAELQRVRTSDLIQCSSCGRILFLA